jgi:hypothetical protein
MSNLQPGLGPEGEEAERYIQMNALLLEARNQAFALRRQPHNTLKTYLPRQVDFKVCLRSLPTFPSTIIIVFF